MLVPIGSNNSAVCRRENMGKPRGMKDILTEEYSPEKAGVGGSIPSLATNGITSGLSTLIPPETLKNSRPVYPRARVPSIFGVRSIGPPGFRRLADPLPVIGAL